ncbi:MAG: SPOR domain-containing protein, partial [Candidatus Neomarinimicrobiota bacterium]
QAIGEDDSVKYYTGIYQSMYPNLDISKYGVQSLGQSNAVNFAKKMTKQPRPYVIQIGAFGSVQNADRLKLQVTQIGYDVAISKVRTNGKSLNAVRVVRFNSKSAAEREGEVIKKKLGIDYRVLYRPENN